MCHCFNSMAYTIWYVYNVICSDNMSSVRYTADYVREQLFVPPFHKVPAKEHAKEKKASVNTTSRNLSRVRKMTSPCNICILVCDTYWTPVPFLAPASGRYVQEIYASRNQISGDRQELNVWDWSMQWSSWINKTWYWWWHEAWVFVYSSSIVPKGLSAFFIICESSVPH